MDLERSASHEEVYDFLLTQPTLKQIITYRPSEVSQQRLSELLESNRTGSLTPDDEIELNEFEKVEHLMIMMKAKAREKLAQQS
jgi:hypothetical protein